MSLIQELIEKSPISGICDTLWRNMTEEEKRFYVSHYGIAGNVDFPDEEYYERKLDDLESRNNDLAEENLDLEATIEERDTEIYDIRTENQRLKNEAIKAAMLEKDLESYKKKCMELEEEIEELISRLRRLTKVREILR